MATWDEDAKLYRDIDGEPINGGWNSDDHHKHHHACYKSYKDDRKGNHLKDLLKLMQKMKRFMLAGEVWADEFASLLKQFEPKVNIVDELSYHWSDINAALDHLNKYLAYSIDVESLWDWHHCDSKATTKECVESALEDWSTIIGIIKSLYNYDDLKVFDYSL